MWESPLQKKIIHKWIKILKKKFSTPFAIREIQIKNTVCYHNIPTKMTDIGGKKTAVIDCINSVNSSSHCNHDLAMGLFNSSC